MSVYCSALLLEHSDVPILCVQHLLPLEL